MSRCDTEIFKNVRTFIRKLKNFDLSGETVVKEAVTKVYVRRSRSHSGHFWQYWIYIPKKVVDDPDFPLKLKNPGSEKKYVRIRISKKRLIIEPIQ